MYKFRAWDMDINRMFEVGTLVDALKQGKDSEHWLLCTNHVLMQSTGLKDKNGIEIYEGDIVHKYKHEAWVVEYSSSGRAAFIVCNQLNSEREIQASCDMRHGRIENNCHEQVPWFRRCGNEEIELEVIGNIYENEDLNNV